MDNDNYVPAWKEETPWSRARKHHAPVLVAVALVAAVIIVPVVTLVVLPHQRHSEVQDFPSSFARPSSCAE